MSISSYQAPLRLLMTLILGIAICVVALYTPRIAIFTDHRPPWISNGVITQTIFLILSLVLGHFLVPGGLKECGLTTRGLNPTPKILLWVLPMAVLSTIGTLASGSGDGSSAESFELHYRDILSIWIYASICEEIFTRGLLQSLVSPLSKHGLTLFKKWHLSLPVLFSGLAFGGMHIVAIPQMGPMVVVFATAMGLVAGHYRELTGSVLPAIIIHALFNIGGSLPPWILSRIL